MNNGSQTHAGSLVTDGLSGTSESWNTAMGMVSDNGSDVDRPVESWIFTILTAVGLLTFLFVSFYRYRKRLREKRNREEEYIRVFRQILPDCDYNDFKVTRARSVMTNTHFNTYPNLDQLEFGVGPPIGRRLFRTFPPHSSSTYRQTTEAERHPYPKGYLGYPLGNPSNESLNNEDGARNYDDYNDIPYMDGYIEDEGKEHDLEKEFTKVFKKGGVKKYNKSKVNGKSRRKKHKSFLKSKAKTNTESSGDFIEIRDFNQNSYLSDLYINYRMDESTSGAPLTSKRQIRSDSDLYAFTSEEFNPMGRVTFAQNDYYMEAGLPKPAKPQGYSGKRRRSSVISTGKDSVKANAFYDRLVPRGQSSREYEELVHRDTKGFVTAHARSLPCLDTEYHRNHVNNVFRSNEADAHVQNEPRIVNSDCSPRRSSDPLLRSMDGSRNKASVNTGVPAGSGEAMKVLLDEANETSEKSGN